MTGKLRLPPFLVMEAAGASCGGFMGVVWSRRLDGSSSSTGPGEGGSAPTTLAFGVPMQKAPPELSTE